MPLRTLNKLRRSWFGRQIAVWYHPLYRLPLAGLESHMGMEPRRADFAAWFLTDRGIIPFAELRTARSATYEELARVHTADYLESLSRPAELAAVFSVQPGEIEVDEVMHSVRLATGATIDAARWAARNRLPALNLLGGFHHAGPAFGGGFCPVNDIAVAVAALRHSGWKGTVAVLDLDAHPPDGTSACFLNDPTVWLASISGSDWGPLPNVDETVVPVGTGDEGYLAALEKLLARMPRADLAFVIAGGDVIAGDRFGALGMSIEGVRKRDLMVAEALDGIGSVWVPGGGYSQRAWRVLAGVGLALALKSKRPIDEDYDPLRARFSRISAKLAGPELGEDPGEMSFADLESALGIRTGRHRMLDYYTAEGIEHALWKYGALEPLTRLGYRQLRIAIDEVDQGDRMRVFGHWGEEEHLLIETVLERRRVADKAVLFIHWLTLRHPRVPFESARPRLPGQDVPGLGMAREASELLMRMARRLELEGVVFRPAWFHMAFAARSRFQFVDDRRQGRFEAMLRDFKKIPLLEATMAVAEGRVFMNGRPYVWEAEDMIFLNERRPPERSSLVNEERENTHFTLAPKAGK